MAAETGGGVGIGPSGHAAAVEEGVGGRDSSPLPAATASGGIGGGGASREESERIVSDGAVTASDHLSMNVEKSEDDTEEWEYGQGNKSFSVRYLRNIWLMF